MKKKKLKFYILIVLVASVAIYSLVWFINYSKYTLYNNCLDYDVLTGDYYTKQDGKVYSSFPPLYPSFAGNLSITTTTAAKRGETVKSVNMIIWPEFCGGYSVGITINSWYVDEEKSEGNKYFTACDTVSLVMDEHMNPIDEDSNKVLEENQDMIEEIKEMYKCAYDKWGILG